MAVKLSTGLGTALMGASGIDTALNLGFIKIYSGAVPAGANDSLGAATLLLTISNNSTGTGLTLGTAAGGAISKTSGEVWSGVVVAGGTPSFYRFVAPGDTGGASTTEVRLQGTVATAGADLNMTNNPLVVSATETVTVYNLNIPVG